MKRDMDLVRKILFKMEDINRPNVSFSTFKVEGYSRSQIEYHMKIMGQAGLLHIDEDEITYPAYGIGMSSPTASTKVVFQNYSLSWEGHEFLDAARDDKRWDKAKTAMSKAGGFVLPVMMQLLTSFMKAELKLPSR